MLIPSALCNDTWLHGHRHYLLLLWHLYFVKREGKQKSTRLE